jgi:predicted ATPase
MVQRIVITGAPGSGKTNFIEKLKEDSQFSCFTFFDELARKLLDEYPDYRQNWTIFHRDIYRLQIERENNLPEKLFISDRGTVDTFAFHPETVDDVGTTLKDEYDRYDAVIQLESAANLGNNYYRIDNIRLETIEEALEIENKITNIWKNHPNYIMIKAKSDIDEKYADFYKVMTAIIEV